jgi:hypothetical protein
MRRRRLSHKRAAPAGPQERPVEVSVRPCDEAELRPDLVLDANGAAAGRDRLDAEVGLLDHERARRGEPVRPDLDVDPHGDRSGHPVQRQIGGQPQAIRHERAQGRRRCARWSGTRCRRTCHASWTTSSASLVLPSILYAIENNSGRCASNAASSVAAMAHLVLRCSFSLDE